MLPVAVAAWQCAPQIAVGDANDRRSQASPAPDKSHDDDIVVVGRRKQTIDDPDKVIEGDELKSYAATTIGDLLAKLRNDVDPFGNELAVIVNGRRESEADSITNYPADAVEAIEVVPTKDGTKLGYSGTQRVVNIVLKRHFKSTVGELSTNAPTRGARNTISGQISRFIINGDSRTSISSSANFKDKLIASERNTSLAPASILNSSYVSTSPGEVELDPLLSQIAGYPISYATIRDSVTGGSLAFSDIQEIPESALLPAGDYYTLRPSDLSATTTLDHSISIGGIRASVHAKITWDRSTSLSGPAITQIEVAPSGQIFPFSLPIMVNLVPTPLRALQRQNTSTSAGLGFSVSGQWKSWQWRSQIDYSEAWSQSNADSLSVGPTPDAAILAALTGESTLTVRSQLDRASARSSQGSAEFGVSGSALKLPAGAVSLALSGRAGFVRFRQAGIGGQSGTRQTSGTLNVSTSVPVLSPEIIGTKFGSFNVRLGWNAFVSGNLVSIRNFSGIVEWAPAKWLGLRLSGTSNAEPAKPEELSAALIYSPNIPVYDPVRNRVTTTTVLTGGNPRIPTLQSTAISAGGFIRFAGGKGSLSMDYQTRGAYGGAIPFPIVTASLIAAYPARFTRDADGNLILVDARLLEVNQSRSDNIKIGFSFSLPFRFSIPKGGKGLEANRAQISFNDNWLLKDKMSFSGSSFILDRIVGEAGGRRPKHKASLNSNFNLGGIGSSFSIDWTSPSKVIPDANRDPYIFHSVFSASISVFSDLEKLFTKQTAPMWVRQSRLSISVNGLFKRQRVSVPLGGSKAGYLPDDFDPIGPVISMNLRKAF